MNPWFSTSLGALALAVLAPMAGAAMPSHDAARQIELGHHLYDEHCASCHRADGRGGVHFAHAVSADLQAPGLERDYHHSDALIVRAILEARDEDGERLDQPMPAWRGRLSPTQARAIVAYLHTLHGPAR